MTSLFRWLRPNSQRNTGQQRGAPDFSRIHRNADRVAMCHGCSRIEMLFEKQRDDEIRGVGEPQRSLALHSSFSELDACARVCRTCRVFRQALLLRQITIREDMSLGGVMELGEEMEKMEKMEAADTLVATLFPRTNPGQVSRELHIRIGKHVDNSMERQRCATVNCWAPEQKNPAHLQLVGDPLAPEVFRRAKSWLAECVENHAGCGNLRWSNSAPTRLIQIISATEVQLVGFVPSETKYMALSYCWGRPTDLLDSRVIEEGRTTKKNVSQRYVSFPRTGLPATIRDAITFAERIGIGHLWVDSICIVQDDTEDWAREPATMHQVYGNSHLTLCVCCNDTATTPIFRERRAWSLPLSRCRLDRYFISCSGLELDDIRQHAPLSKRAWAVREEHLSPRVLYWSTQRMYWSCSRMIHTEGVPREDKKEEAGTAPQLYRKTSPAQNFLIACREERDSLHDDWLDVVQRYARRSLTKETDRFTALSGLATRLGLVQGGDTYLAGLWKSNFARDLAWFFERKVVKRDKSLAKLAPSWSWASLPLETAVAWDSDFQACPSFELVPEPATNPPQNDSETQDSVVKSVLVRGRLRLFCNPQSKRRSWTGVHRIHHEQEVFDLAPDENIFSVEIETGRVLSYEARKREVIGQLDYVEDAKMIDEGKVLVYALEIGQSNMLLLQQQEEKATYRRIGVSRQYRSMFFADAPLEQICLR